MPVNAELLSLLVCPETKTPLEQASKKLLDQLNNAIALGQLKNRSGQVVKTPVTEGLVRADKCWLYIVRDNTPVMLIEEALPLTNFIC